MITHSRRGALVALALLLSASSLSAQQKPWDQAAFTSDPEALVAAARGVAAGDFSLVMLLDEAEYVIDAEGHTRSRERVMLYVVSDAGVDNASEVRAGWQPWHDERPSIEARVVTVDGTLHLMDASAVVEVPSGEQTDIFSDRRILRAPLPAVAAGSVVEYVVTRSSRNPIPGAGTAIHYEFGGYLPIERTRVSLDAPRSATLHLVNETGIQPRVEEKDGQVRTMYETGRIEGVRELDGNVPYDVVQRPYLAFSTGTSWQEIATSYSAIVDKQSANADLQKIVRGAIGKATERKEVVARLLAAIQKDVRYAGIEIGEGSIVPRTPRQVLANKYGDCKDKAALLVAMLRMAGFPAHVALLNASDGFDVLPTLPALGHFNHAIVVVDGQPAIWADPTDVYARAGELPLLDQGRLALIAKPETTTLTRTPELDSTAHVYLEQRTFILPEEGEAKVTEITMPNATSEANLRRWIAGSDAKKLREDIEAYAKSAYVAKTMTGYESTEVNDLTKPFRLTVEVPESKSGVVGNGEGSVAINAGALPQNVPNALRDWKETQPGQSEGEAPKKRTHDFLFPQPGVREWVYRIVPPAGYVPRTLPASGTRQLGTMTFRQELRTEPDQSVVATFRFDSGKRRLSVAEFEETRMAFTKFIAESPVTIGFQQAGQAKLNAGDVRGALDEFRRLAALHPKEAQHHLEMARGLLTGGLGDAAREEVRRAIALEPNNARAHQQLGATLLHDSLGRPYRRGFDLQGAIAAFRRAKELDPDDYNIRVALESTLSYGENGIRFSRDARLEEAVSEVQAMVRELGEPGKAALPELTLLYSHMGRFADVRALAPTLENDQQRDLAQLIATAALDGTEAVIRELGAFDQQKKRSYASGVAQLLMQVRLYPQAAALMDVATQGTAAAAEQRQFIGMLEKLKRVEDLPKDEGPRSVVSKLFMGMLHNDIESLKQLVPAEYSQGEESPLADMSEMEMRPPDDLPLPLFGDLLASIMDVQQDGDEATGYRLRMRPTGGTSLIDKAFLVRREEGRWLIRGGTGDDSMTGDTVLTMAAAGELETARKWLNWAREDAKGGTSDDPLEGDPLAILWPRSKAAATAEEIRLAAASMATDKFGWDKSEPILLEARERAQSEPVKAAIDLSLSEIYEGRKDWPRMLAVTSRLIASNPDSATAFSTHVDALLMSGKAPEAALLANQRLERLPGDRDAVRALSRSAAAAGDYDAAQQYATKVIDELRPKQQDFTRAAWSAVFTGKQLERALEHAQSASKEKEKTKDEAKDDQDAKAAGLLHALAALYAETGRNVEARTALLEGIEEASGMLQAGDWYVLGRIAENYGVEDVAISSYRKVDSKRGGSATVAPLAKRRLEKLVKKK